MSANSASSRASAYLVVHEVVEGEVNDHLVVTVLGPRTLSHSAFQFDSGISTYTTHKEDNNVEEVASSHKTQTSTKETSRTTQIRNDIQICCDLSIMSNRIRTGLLDLLDLLLALSFAVLALSFAIGDHVRSPLLVPQLLALRFSQPLGASFSSAFSTFFLSLLSYSSVVHAKIFPRERLRARRKRRCRSDAQATHDPCNSPQN